MKRTTCMILAGVAGCAGALAAQELTARQLFYRPDPPPAKTAPKAVRKAPATKPQSLPKKAEEPASSAAVEVPVAGQTAPLVVTAGYTVERPLGLRYALAQVENAAESEVSPTATFHAGDAVRVNVEGNRDGYLYVIARGSSGNWRPLFPAPDINGGNNRIVAHRGYRLPSDTQAFTFDEQAGEERLFVVYSAEPVKDIDELIPSLTTPAKEVPAPGPVVVAGARQMSEEFVAALRNAYSRDLIVQTVAPGQPGASAPGPATLPESAVYIVSKSGGRLVADIRLEHK